MSVIEKQAHSQRLVVSSSYLSDKTLFRMTNLTDVPLIRCIVLGDSDRLEMLRRYADLSGLPYDEEVSLHPL